MIHFYQKRVLQGRTISEAWLNEMASEVAEDLIADKLMVERTARRRRTTTPRRANRATAAVARRSTTSSTTSR